MEQILQVILASGIVTTIVTLIISRIVNGQLDQIKHMQQTKTESDFLLWTKIDMQGELIELMALKLHEAGVINGDLEEVKKKYKQASDDYEKHIRHLAAEVLRK